MYEFNDLEKNTRNRSIPSYAMLIDGEPIESLIPEFTTLSVYGREHTEIDFQIYEVGNKKKNKSMKHKIITINYTMDAKNNADYRRAFNRFNYLLFEKFNNKRYVNFKDEPRYYYEVELYSVESVVADTNTVASSFSLISETPYKFSEIKQAEKIDGLEFPLYPIKIETIQAVASQGQLFKLSNITTGKNIVLLDNFSGGEAVEITGDDIKINKISSLNKLDFIKSDFKDFEIYSGDEVVANSNEKIKNKL